MLECFSRLMLCILVQNTSWHLRRYEKTVAARTRGSKNYRPVPRADKSFVHYCEHLFSAASRFSRHVGQRVTHAEHGQRHECSCKPASAEVANSRQRAPVIGQPMHSYQSLPE